MMKQWTECKWLNNYLMPRYAICGKLNGFTTLRNGKVIEGYPCYREKCDMIE